MWFTPCYVMHTLAYLLSFVVVPTISHRDKKILFPSVFLLPKECNGATLCLLRHLLDHMLSQCTSMYSDDVLVGDAQHNLLDLLRAQSSIFYRDITILIPIKLCTVMHSLYPTGLHRILQSYRHMATPFCCVAVWHASLHTTKMGWTEANVVPISYANFGI